METIQFIGFVSSPLKTLKDCPRQEREGAPPASIRILAKFRSALSGLHVGSQLWVFTWLHQSDRTTLKTRPRNNPKAKLTGVFATRSPDRPNPIGMHQVEILAISKTGKLNVSNLEVLDGTPIVDIKPVI
jgi:tRNA-Thr(GGU) m(6)t(6)A37 methyltransferase TsaA